MVKYHVSKKSIFQKRETKQEHSISWHSYCILMLLLDHIE